MKCIIINDTPKEDDIPSEAHVNDCNMRVSKDVNCIMNKLLTWTFYHLTDTQIECFFIYVFHYTNRSA